MHNAKINAIWVGIQDLQHILTSLAPVGVN